MKTRDEAIRDLAGRSEEQCEALADKMNAVMDEIDEDGWPEYDTLRGIAKDSDREDVQRLRALLSYGLPPHVSVQTGEGTNAPAAVFADADFEVGDGVCGLHASGKQASEPCIPYLRADALMHALALVAEAYEAAAASLEDRGSDGWAENVIAEYASVNAEAIRSLTPSDALAAREARDKRVRNEALREAADCVGHITQAEDRDAILALIGRKRP